MTNYVFEMYWHMLKGYYYQADYDLNRVYDKDRVCVGWTRNGLTCFLNKWWSDRDKQKAILGLSYVAGRL
jgi:hypothetical protein